MNLLKRIQGKGTFVTSSIPGNIDNGNIVYLTICRDDRQFSPLDVTGDVMGTELLRRGYHLRILMSGQTPSSSIVRSLEEVRGVIATGWMNQDWIKVLNALSIPVVFLGSEMSGELNVPSVDFDWMGMAEMLTCELLKQGARRLGLIIGGEDYSPSTWMIRGFQNALEKNALEYSSSLVCFSDSSAPLSIDAFLRKNDNFDGFVIERGCYIHVLNSLLNRFHRPAMAVMSSDASNVTGICEKKIEAVFRENIYVKSVELLFKSIESNNGDPDNVKIAPHMLN
jgi:DNA-binding LacI/PurR family transcriptional regulator